MVIPVTKFVTVCYIVTVRKNFTSARTEKKYTKTKGVLKMNTEDMISLKISAMEVLPHIITRTIRKSRGEMSQDMLGSLCGVDQSTISRIESGSIEDPSYSTVYNALYACGYKLVAVPVKAECRI